MKILGISAFYHDSAAAILLDGEIIAAAQEERFTRKKHDPSFPTNAIRFCLEYAGCAINDIDAIVFYDKPFLKFERLLETAYAFAPRGLLFFITAMPVWLKEKLFLKRIIYSEINKLEKMDKKKVKLLFSNHHLSHAASAFFPSPFKKAAILTIDAVGEWATASIHLGEGNQITLLKQLDFPHSAGLLYSSFTYYCGFKVNAEEYKLMGLAPYGNPNGERTKSFIHIIKNVLTDLKEDGSLFLHQQYFKYTTGLRMTDDKKWANLLGIPPRKPEDAITQPYCDLAFAIQSVMEEVVVNMAKEAKRLTNASAICLAGGVALNSVANGKLDAANLYNELFIQPAAGDAGGALGAALAGHYIYFNSTRECKEITDAMHGSLLGTAFADGNIHSMVEEYNAVFTRYEHDQALLDNIALLLSKGNIIGWHQGRMEFGPRALGARSILADPGNPGMQKELNLKIKYRESFRPFAPAVLAEDAADYFELKGTSPYMLLVKQIKQSRQYKKSGDYQDWSLAEKINFLNSDLPAITHVDYSARIQTVDRETNPRFWELLQAFKKITGYGMLVNTSFNVAEEPIVNTPREAYRCFMSTKMDYLVVSNFLFKKSDQPVWSANNKQEDRKIQGHATAME